MNRRGINDEVIINVHRFLDEEFLKQAQVNDMPDGATSLVAMIKDDRLTISNLGDSSAILIRNN